MTNFRKRLHRYWLAITYRLRPPESGAGNPESDVDPSPHYELVDIEIFMISSPDEEDDPGEGAIRGDAGLSLGDDGDEGDADLILFEEEPPIGYHVPFPFGGGLWLIYVDGRWKIGGLD